MNNIICATCGSAIKLKPNYTFTSKGGMTQNGFYVEKEKEKEKSSYKENSNKKVFNIDYDHTLTKDKKGEYSPDPLPNIPVITKLKELYMLGHIIIIWSARPWGDSAKLASWLTKCGVPYHGIKLEKGGTNFYVDDKCLLINDFLCMPG